MKRILVYENWLRAAPTRIGTLFVEGARGMKAMDSIPYEARSYYVFDRAYNDFRRLALIDSLGCFFVIIGLQLPRCDSPSRHEIEPLPVRNSPDSGNFADRQDSTSGTSDCKKS